LFAIIRFLEGDRLPTLPDLEVLDLPDILDEALLLLGVLID